MSQIKNFIFIVFILISITAFAQKAIDEDPELVQNNINYRIAQSQTELENFNYYKAKVNLDEALEIADKADNKKILGIIYAKKGRLELIFEELDKAIKSLNKAIEIQRILNDNVNLGSSYKTFGDIYLAKEDYYSALDSYTAAKSKFEEEDLNEELAETLLCEGKTYYQLKNYKKARDVVEQSLAIAKKYDYLKIQSDALINHAKIYDKLRNKEKALEVALSGLQIARTNSFTNILNEGYEVTSNLYFGLEEHKLSRNYLNAHLKLSDSIRGLTRINSSRNQETQFRLNEEIEKRNQNYQML